MHYKHFNYVLLWRKVRQKNFFMTLFHSIQEIYISSCSPVFQFEGLGVACQSDVPFMSKNIRFRLSLARILLRLCTESFMTVIGYFCLLNVSQRHVSVNKKLFPKFVAQQGALNNKSVGEFAS